IIVLVDIAISAGLVQRHLSMPHFEGSACYLNCGNSICLTVHSGSDGLQLLIEDDGEGFTQGMLEQ
ncbi:MAG: hypothetical protein JAY74_26030, partial [Candidatus Thiodiazotropha taylori]|nr:hypothetical protein [Candidatus Thiodiazotropha taylori]